MSFEIGERVKVVPKAESTAVSIRKFEDHVFTVSKVKWFKTTRYYELQGCVSEKGVPYSFAGDWLQKVTP